MHVNQILVQCLERTMIHSLPQVELWSIRKKSCNQPICAQNCTNSVWHGIFQIIQNPWRIRRSCNYKSCSKLLYFSTYFLGICLTTLLFFPWIIRFRHLFSSRKTIAMWPTCQWRWGRYWAHLSAPCSHQAATRHRVGLCARVKTVRHHMLLASPSPHHQ
jgi:hypothetical protein